MNDETERAEKLFTAASRKIEKQIEAVRTGDKSAEVLVRTAIDRLYDRAFKPEIRGSEPVRERCYAKIEALRASFRDAIELGTASRCSQHRSEIARLKSEESHRNW